MVQRLMFLGKTVFEAFWLMAWQGSDVILFVSPHAGILCFMAWQRHSSPIRDNTLGRHSLHSNGSWRPGTGIPRHTVSVFRDSVPGHLAAADMFKVKTQRARVIRGYCHLFCLTAKMGLVKANTNFAVSWFLWETVWLSQIHMEGVERSKT